MRYDGNLFTDEIDTNIAGINPKIIEAIKRVGSLDITDIQPVVAVTWTDHIKMKVKSWFS